MWKYLVLNLFWFAFLFLCPYAERKIWRFLAFISIWVVAAWTVLNFNVDPFAWVFYLVFSFIVFWSGGKFHSWAYARLQKLDEEIEVINRELETQNRVLDIRKKATETVNERASEIEHLFGKVKEMSKSLFISEAFLVFAEALAGHFRFQTIQLAIFNEDSGAQAVEDVLELKADAFKEVFDRSIYLKEPAKLKTAITPFHKKIYEIAFQEKQLLKVLESEKGDHYKIFSLWPDFRSFVSYPILIQDKIFAVLTILDLSEKELPVLSILTERFISEIQRIKLYQRVQTLAITDGLTGTYVRRYLLERLAGEIERSDRFGFKLSFLMIDIDHFKRFNDFYGHLVGDVVLRQVAETIKKSTRELDMVGRYGGEEFGVILVETDEPGALYVAERIRKAIAEKDFSAYQEKLKVTVSIGCAAYRKSDSDINAFIDRADQALYEAKHQGRNRVAMAPDHV